MLQSAVFVFYVVCIPLIFGIAIIAEYVIEARKLPGGIFYKYSTRRGINNRIQYRLMLIRQGKL